MARQTQHRAERDNARGRELSTLRKENQQLKRQVARLQRQISKLEGEQAMYEAGVEAREDMRKQVGKPRPEPCACGSFNIKTLTTPGGAVIRVCADCKARMFKGRA